AGAAAPRRRGHQPSCVPVQGSRGEQPRAGRGTGSRPAGRPGSGGGPGFRRRRVVSAGLSPTAARVFDDDVVVLSTGDVLNGVHPYAPVGPRRRDQHYRFAAGSPDVCAAIARYATGRYTVDAGQVVVAPGARQAVHLVLAAALTDRREVLIPSPYWASYPTL